MAVPSVLTRADGLLRLSDGTHTMTIEPCMGDFATTRTQPVETYTHRKGIIASGAGVVAGEDAPAVGTWGCYLVIDPDTIDAEDVYSLLRWWTGDDDSTTEIDGAGWTSTTDRSDGRRTLHVEWWPTGVATGRSGWRIPDALLTELEIGDGDPDPVAITATSTTTARATHLVAS